MGRATGDAPPASGAARPAEATIRAAVFDYGGVLTTPVRESIAAWLAADGIRPETFSAALKAWMSRSAPVGTPVHRLETGELAIEEFERLLAAELATHDGSPVVAEGLLTRLFGAMRLDDAMIELVRELRDRGLRTVLLSNSWGNTYPRALIAEIFDGVVISGEVGLRKPDPRIYRLALDHAGVAPAEAVFVDDASPNTDAAAAVGMRAIRHTDAATTRARLAELVPGITTADIS
ncbi:HAD family hydrolase [Gandjariella thermophila]|uniref:Phosphoglycolate phosphatase n=1 Tax=Gandjariella thermophila TaxID=1931992 RepID=A0A4D4J3N3_9PSEU|nr:HAD family phosphatase [Gandjariella thermophila]GDY29106.1 phosphoglycolate phosphatase [Gandjariella thermophila]